MVKVLEDTIDSDDCSIVLERHTDVIGVIEGGTKQRLDDIALVIQFIFNWVALAYWKLQLDTTLL
jgi:hypothetical protein